MTLLRGLLLWIEAAFASGVMNLTVIAVLTAFVALEELAPLGVHGARISGMLLMPAGFWMVLR